MAAHGDPSTWFEGWWRAYVDIAPHAQGLFETLAPGGGVAAMDHVAIRTLNLKRYEIADFHGVLEEAGYTETGRYVFPRKRLLARSYRHCSGALPRIFISELQVGDLSNEAASLLTDLIARQVASGLELLFTSPSRWRPPTHAVYRRLLEVSEYAAWLSAFGIRVNHFTFGLDQLPAYPSIHALVQALQASGYALNGQGDHVEGTPAGGLEQASTVAELVPRTFAQGHRAEVRSCYVEFAQRHADQEGVLFDGFIPSQAAVIFDSTNMHRP